MVKEFIALHNIPEYLQGTLREYFAQEQTATKGDDIESVRKCVCHTWPVAIADLGEGHGGLGYSLTLLKIK